MFPELAALLADITAPLRAIAAALPPDPEIGAQIGRVEQAAAVLDRLTRTAAFWDAHNHSEIVPCVQGLCPGYERAGQQRKHPFEELADRLILDPRIRHAMGLTQVQHGGTAGEARDHGAAWWR